MNYEKIYNSIIANALKRESILNELVHRHHIIPIFMNGQDVKENVVYLTIREHYLCHVLLAKLVPKNKRFAAVKSCYLLLSWAYNRESTIKIQPGASKKLLKNLLPPMPQETRDKLGIAAIKQFQDPIKRQNHLDGVNRRWEDPNERNKHGLLIRQRYKDNPEEGKKIGDSLREFFAIHGSHNKGKKRPKLSEVQLKPCTINGGEQIYPSVAELIKQCGTGKNGSKSPHFRYVLQDGSLVPRVKRAPYKRKPNDKR
jgi:hypothetical protein